ncbi:MAG: D-aminoacylase [Cyclobacteriaceae bacterium]|nr:D-aminoacylase [Cyclobacteriaceae bacterium]
MKDSFFTFLFFYGLVLALFTHCTPREKFDLIISGGIVIDGTGEKGFPADVGITGDQITAIGDLKNREATRVIAAAGMVVSPGFIDMHTHLEPLFNLPLCESHARQGVTTALGGPDGGGPWPFGAYLDSAQNAGIGINVAYLVGHNTVRRNIMGLDDRQPTDEELEEMKSQIVTGMKEGAFGISTGLKYLPGTFSEIDEVISLSKVASQHGGIYTSHLREEGLGLLAGVKEAISIAREANIPVVLTHHKAIGVKMWGASSKTLAMVDSARNLGLDIMIDQYPYAASHTGIAILIPSWALEGGNQKFTTRCNNPVLRDSIKAGIIFNILNDRGGSDLHRVQFSRVSWQEELEGKTLHDWAEMEGLEPTVENGADLVIRAQLNGGLSAIYHAMDEADVENIMKHPMTMTGSDGALSRPGNGHPHPRAYGTFPRVLGHYVREKNIMTLETAIHKMTGLSAQRLGLSNRGIIKENVKADIVVFDPKTIKDKSTFENPHQYPEGIHYVIINGTFAVDEGNFTKKGKGEVLRGPAFVK